MAALPLAPPKIDAPHFGGLLGAEMIDLKLVEKTSAYWVFKQLIEEIEALKTKIAELEDSKADRKGPKRKAA